MKRFYIILCFIAGLFAAQSLEAHLLWLNIDNYQPRIDETVQIDIGWGHKFPEDGVIKEEFLNRVYALDASGKEVPLTKISLSQYKFTPKKEGTYRILANVHPGYVTKTTQGYKLKSKKDLQEVLSCFRYDIRAKAIIIVDGKRENNDSPADDPLVIIPLKNTDQLKEGDLFPLKVIYDGKPLPNADINATYKGFSDQSNTFAFTTLTDKNGEARVKLSKNGTWLVTATHKVPYPDPEVCDENSYKYSVSFKVK